MGLGGALACGETSRTRDDEVFPSAGRAPEVGGEASSQAGVTSAGGGRAGSPGGGAAGTALGGGVSTEGCERCRDLPRVRQDVDVACRGGECVYVAGSCEEGFEHCSGNFSEVGCEADLRQPAHCGRCAQVCEASQICLVPSGFVCSTCSFPTPVACGNVCSDLQNDSANCGACGRACEKDVQVCKLGACVDCESDTADCNGVNRCDVSLLESAHCGACANDCSTADRFGWCAPQDTCETLACKAGYGDCDGERGDCEKSLDQTTDCGPTFLSTTLLSDQYEWLFTDLEGRSLARRDGELYRVAPDGQVLWKYSAPNVGVTKVRVSKQGLIYVMGNKVRVAGVDTADIGTFVAKLNPDGTTAWQRELMPSAGAGQATYEDLSADDAGNLSLAVRLTGEVDVDPTPAVDLQQFDNSEIWLFDLASDGSVSWVRALGEGTCHVSVQSVARNSDYILVTGSSSCEIGGEPPPAANGDTAFIARLSSTGETEAVRWLSDTSFEEGLLVVHPGTVGSALTGAMFGELVLDDGPSVLARSSAPTAFVAHFSATLELEWLKVASRIRSLDLAPDGGIMALVDAEPVSRNVLALWRDDGSSAWTIPLGCHSAIGASSTEAGFAVRATGMVSAESCDLDPGPGLATTEEGAVVILYGF